MRLVILGLSLILTASAPLAATAQSPVSTQPLAQGEVLLEVSALGMVTTRADRATLTFNIAGTGETEAAARTATEASVREVRAALRALGVADADIQVQPVSAHAVESVEPELSQMELNTASGEMNAVAVEAGPSASGNAQAVVTVRSVDRVPAIQAMLMQRGIFSVAGATYTLNDEAAPRRRARAQAMQKARADAEAYAASLNMRVARIVRVTERLGLEMLSMAASESQLLTQLFSPAMMRATGPDVPTMVVVGVDFALAPR